ncbi:GntR family transcriptional regulator [Micromonospora sp. NBC_01699]|uniref:GntR family transcriptional regulator n=1 Tax=Micromonospora sp. NBC_01699 TaxID=2975984 RepID=UPI002E2B6291|nr:GntR family transcriptional regulator [Micromonospora sp. NBC_01699]
MGSGPAYQRVADEIRAAILSGELAQGDRMPSLPELATRFGVTTTVAHNAVNVLRGEGLVVTRQGAGAYVRRFERIRRSSPGRLARSHWGQGRAIQDHDTGVRARVLGVVVGEVPAPEYVAAALGVDSGTAVLSRARRFEVDGRPVQLATSYLPLELVRGTAITYTDTGPGGAYARLAELGFAPVRFVERLTDRAPNQQEREQLALSSGAGARVIEITRFAYDGSDRCVEVTRMVLDATAYELEYEFLA